MLRYVRVENRHYSVSGNVVRVHILICAAGQKLCRNKEYPDLTLNF